MEIQLGYATQAEVPTEHAALYTEQGGVYKLTGVVGLVAAMAAGGGKDALSKALDSERTAHKATKADLATAKNDQATAVIERDTLQLTVDSMDKKPDTAEIDALVERRVALIKGPLELKLQAAESKSVEHETALTTALGRETTARKEKIIRTKATEAGITEATALNMAVRLMAPDMEFDDGGNLIASEGGTFSPGIDIGMVLSTEAKESYPNLWPVSEGGGARTPGGVVDGKDNPFTHDKWNMTQALEIMAKDLPLAERMAKAAGADLDNLRRPEPPK